MTDQPQKPAAPRGARACALCDDMLSSEVARRAANGVGGTGVLASQRAGGLRVGEA